MTPSVSAPTTMGQPKAPCSPSLAAGAARGKLASWTTSRIQCGLPVAQTWPGSPSPRPNVRRRLAASNSGGRHSGPVPAFETVQCIGVGPKRPEEAHVPAQAFAHGSQNARGSVLDGCRLRKDLGDGESGIAVAFLTLPVGDVPQVGREQRRAVRGDAGDRQSRRGTPCRPHAGRGVRAARPRTGPSPVAR